MALKRSGRIKYITWFLILLLVEITIAAFMQDKFVRPYLGDFLVVMLIYCFLMSISNISVFKALILVFLFSFSVEFLQLINIVKVLQYQPPKIVMIALGSDFSVWDLLAYSLGILFTGFLELKFQSKEQLA